MKNLKYFFFLFGAFLFLLPACKEDEMPEPVPFRCKVNGVEWTPAIPEGSQWGGGNAMNLQYYDDVKTISMGAQRNLSNQTINQSISFSAESIVIGKNRIKTEKGNYRRVYKDWLKEGECLLFDLDTLKSHVIIIDVLDREKRIISGTFQFSAINFDYDHIGESCNESVDITDGEFHFSY